MAASHLALRVLAVRQGQRIRAARCGVFFPLNPSPLPWGEGEPFSPQRTIQTRRLSTARCALFPLPEGEGQVRGNGVAYHPACRSIPGTVELGEFSGRARGRRN